MESNKEVYAIVVGEIGNEIGHRTVTKAQTPAGAMRCLKKALRPYRKDGWGHVECNGERLW